MKRLKIKKLRFFKLGQILAVGSGSPDHNHVELATVARSTWATKVDYPYHGWISGYAMVTFDEHYIVFGGYDRKVLTSLKW